MAKKITNTAPKADLYQTITDKVLALLEGGKLPWHQPWAAGVDGGAIARPIRATGEAYNGINILLLWSAAAEAGYTNPQWMTFKQAIEFGGAVRKGEKATMCVYANSFAKIEENEQGQDEERRIPFLKQYHVFNVEQIDGLPDRFSAANVPAAPRNPQDRDDAAEAFFAATGADIRHGGNKAFHAFDGVTSFVQMPKFEAFDDAEAYYATLAHEMIHWTKTPSRLDREFGRKRFGDEGYAMEELVAEMGAAFLLAPLERLLDLAKSDTGQARRAADFVLAWWNAESNGGFDLTHLFNVDASIAADMAEIVAWMAAQEGMCVYPTEYRADIEEVMEQWRPEVMKRARGA